MISTKMRKFNKILSTVMSAITK
uniref:Uncharacterized protein n=1 Tax=Anguilla anguilla TaxID=7936 RepID=A0A0E9SFD7_ANGAN